LNLKGIAITDHETFQGVKLAMDNNPYENIEIIPGEEVNTNWGDVLCLCIQEELKSRNFFDLIKEVSEQKGIIILPHPLKGHNPKIFSNLENIHGIEIHNGRTKNHSKEIIKIIKKYPHLVPVGGSDAHLPWEIGNSVTIIEKLDKTEDITFCNAIQKYKTAALNLRNKNMTKIKISIALSKTKKKLWGKRIARNRSKK
jgi:predicted metal-dependent phosphoesterase TrpH